MYLLYLLFYFWLIYSRKGPFPSTIYYQNVSWYVFTMHLHLPLFHGIYVMYVHLWDCFMCQIMRKPMRASRWGRSGCACGGAEPGHEGGLALWLVEAGAELYMPTLMHMYQGKIFFYFYLWAKRVTVHQVRLKNVRREDINLTTKGSSLSMYQGKFSSSSAPGWKKACMVAQSRQPEREKKLARRLINRRPPNRRWCILELDGRPAARDAGVARAGGQWVAAIDRGRECCELKYIGCK
jgi:hypothetical protein